MFLSAYPPCQDNFLYRLMLFTFMLVFSYFLVEKLNVGVSVFNCRCLRVKLYKGAVFTKENILPTYGKHLAVMPNSLFYTYLPVYITLSYGAKYTLRIHKK